MKTTPSVSTGDSDILKYDFKIQTVKEGGLTLVKI